MSSRASRPRPASSRSRRQRLAAGAVLATTSLLGTYLAAIRPQPSYASPNSGGTVEVGSTPTMAPRSIGTMAIPTCGEADDTVTTENQLRNAITSSVDGDVICVQGTITLNQDLPTLDDTTVTFVGDDSVSSVIDGSYYYSGLRSYPSGPGDDTLTVVSLGFSNFKTNTKGGAIYVDNNGTLIVTDSTFSDNYALQDGGAIFLDNDGTLFVTSSTFSRNYGYRDGGAICMDPDGTLTVTGSTFSTNVTPGEGGAIYLIDSGSVSVTGSTFSSNRSGSHGGAIGGDVDGFVYSSRFTGNTAGGDGGAIDIDYIKGESLYFKDDTAAGSGGAIYVDGSGSTITLSTFKGNEAGVDGGGIYFYGAGTVTSSVFRDNRADQKGGGIYFDGVGKVYSSTFSANRATNEDGGGIFFDVNGYVYSSVLIGNYAGDDGGGARFVAGGVISSSLLQGNDALGDGGGAWIGGDNSVVSRITGSSFINNGDNTAPTKGGGLYFVDNGPLEVSNSTFIGNKAQLGGGIIIPNANPSDDTISYTTISGNTATGGAPSQGGGILAPNSGLALLNSIVSGNSSDDSYVDARLGAGSIENNLFTSAATTDNAGTNAAFGSPLLAAVGNNGGPLIGDDSLDFLPTAIPAWNSPAVGLADPDLTSITKTQIGTDRVGNVAGSMNAAASPTPPTPPVTYPPSAPLNVTGTAADASATITWTAPASAGSFPITDYQAVLSPGGASCLIQAPALTCTITGLTNGTTYTATARALNGAGWGAFSTPSEPFTPENPTPPVTKTIVITGTRGTVGGKPGVYADGETTGLVGSTVQARVKLAGQLEYRDGSTRIVQPDGTFRWQRKTGKKVYVYFIADGGEVRSNRVIISAR